MSRVPFQFVVGVLLLMPFFARSAVVEFIGSGEAPSIIGLDLTVTNNNNGTQYQSGELNVTRNLALELYALPANQSAYASVSDLVGEWALVVRGPPTGEVSNGWNTAVNADGSFSLAKQGANVDTWFATQQNPSQDMQAYTINIPKSQLEFDGVPGYNPLTDKQIGLSTGTISDGFVATAGVNSFLAPSQQYTVIPEPGTLGLMGLVLLAVGGGWVLRKRNS